MMNRVYRKVILMVAVVVSIQGMMAQNLNEEVFKENDKIPVTQESEKERHQIRIQGPLFESIRRNIEWAELCKETQVTYNDMLGGLEYLTGGMVQFKNGAYTYWGTAHGMAKTRLRVSGQDYTDPYESCIPYPLCDYKITVSANRITLYLHEQIQLMCEASEKTGQPIRPKDFMVGMWNCHGDTKSFDGLMEGYNSNGLKCKVRSTCKHAIYQSTRVYRGGAKTAKRGVYKIDPMSADPFAPWRVSHENTITIDLNQMAKANHLTKKELAIQLLIGGFDCFPTGRRENKVFSWYIPYYTGQDYVKYLLWKACGLTDADLQNELEKLAAAATEDFHNGRMEEGLEKRALAYRWEYAEKVNPLFVDVNTRILRDRIARETVTANEYQAYCEAYKDIPEVAVVQKEYEELMRTINNRKAVCMVDSLTIESSLDSMSVALNLSTGDTLPYVQDKVRQLLAAREMYVLEQAKAFGKTTPEDEMERVLALSVTDDTRNFAVKAQQRAIRLQQQSDFVRLGVGLGLGFLNECDIHGGFSAIFGRTHHWINVYTGVRYHWCSSIGSVESDGDISLSAAENPEMVAPKAALQYSMISVPLELRYNFIHHYDTYAFVGLGASYNYAFGGGLKVRREEGVVKQKVKDGLNAHSVTGRLRLGLGFQLMEFSVFCDVDMLQPLNKQSAVDRFEQYSGPINGQLNHKVLLGIECSLYF